MRRTIVQLAWLAALLGLAACGCDRGRPAATLADGGGAAAFAAPGESNPESPARWQDSGRGRPATDSVTATSPDADRALAADRDGATTGAATHDSDDAASALPPRAVADELTLDFGTWAPGTVGEHAFKVRNEGQGPLRLTPGFRSCKCADADLPSEPIPPGGSGEVLVHWHTNATRGPYEQTLIVQTNDPAQKELTYTLRGKVYTLLEASPAEVKFPDLHKGETATAETFLFSQAWPDFSIERIETSQPTIQVESREATPEECKAHEALRGYRLFVTIKASGFDDRFSEWAHVRVDPRMAGIAAQKYDINVLGEVVGTTLYGPDLLPGKVVNLGSVTQGQTKRARLTLVVRDKPYELQVLGVESRPAWLKVSLTPAAAATENSAVYRLEMEVPSDAPPGSFMAARRGEVCIRTNNPVLKEMRLQVELAVLPR